MGRMIRQAAALAVRDNRICMVSSRNGKRWVIPKGLIEKNQTPAEAALAEAWEEAGLLGRIEAEPIGTFIYSKNNLDHLVVVYPMIVTLERDKWPEGRLRKREWVTVEEALSRIVEDDLRSIVQSHCGVPEAASVEVS